MKKRTRLLSIILSLSLGLCGCNNSIKDNKTDMIENKNSVDSKIVDKYLDYFKNITYNYNGEEYYLSDYELDKIIDVGNTFKDVNHDNVSTDPYEVFERIKSNSDRLIGIRDDLQSCFIEEGSYNQEFQLLFEVVLYNILSDFCNNETNNIREDFCKFNDLAICCGDLDSILDINNEKTTFLGYYDNDNNTIILDVKSIYEVYNRLFSWNEFTNHSYNRLYDVIMSTLTHEMNHVRQHSCDCRIHAGQEYSSVGFYNEYIPTIIESSAESCIYNKQNYLSQYISKCKSRDFAYDNEREYECFIMLLGLLYNDIDDYYNAICDSDLNGLYKFMGCASKDEIKRIYHILYNIDGLMLRNNLVFDIGGNYTYTCEIEKIVGNKFSYEVLNIFTEDLIKYVSTNNDISSIDAMTLFILAENLALSHTSYQELGENGSIVTNYDKELINNINNTRIHFENFLMEYYRLTDNELYLTVLKSILIVNSKKDDESLKGFREELDSLIERFPLINAIYDGSNNKMTARLHVYSINGIDYKLH